MYNDFAIGGGQRQPPRYVCVCVRACCVRANCAKNRYNNYYTWALAIARKLSPKKIVWCVWESECVCRVSTQPRTAVRTSARKIDDKRQREINKIEKKRKKNIANGHDMHRTRYGLSVFEPSNCTTSTQRDISFFSNSVCCLSHERMHVNLWLVRFREKPKPKRISPWLIPCGFILLVFFLLAI